MVMPAAAIEKNYTIEEYLAFEETALERHEFINGKIIQKTSGTVRHNLIKSNMAFILKSIMRGLKKKKYHVIGSGQKVYIPIKNQIRYPDALVICEKAEFFENRKDIITNPLIIVEVLSDSTRNFDKEGKFELYQRIPSFKEYVLIEQDYAEVTTFFREEKDLWRVNETTDITTSVPLRSIGIDAPMEEIYDNIELEN